jgi:hypothetical protein
MTVFAARCGVRKPKAARKHPLLTIEASSRYEEHDGKQLYLFRLPIHTRSEANVARHEHWRLTAKRAAGQRQTVFLALASWCEYRRLPKPPCVVRLTRIAPRALDLGDNDRTALKHVRDGVADWLGINDRDPRVTWEYTIRREAPRTYGVEIAVRW